MNTVLPGISFALVTITILMISMTFSVASLLLTLSKLNWQIARIIRLDLIGNEEVNYLHRQELAVCESNSTGFLVPQRGH
jgi:hypothetical protein